jgi:hypothetical protein
MSIFSEMSTDELSELLPNNLHPARTEYGNINDRWRMFNTGSKTYSNTGASSLRNLLISTLEEQEAIAKAWVSK